jgi:hypothetical protein
MELDRATVADTLALRELALAYAHHADRREPDRLAALFETDAELRMVQRGQEGAAVVSRGHRQIAAAVGRLRQFDTTYHLVANHRVEVDGDEATGEVYCVAHHVAERDGVRNDVVMFIRYRDRYRRHEEHWLFAERETYVEWTEDRALGPCR